MFTIKQISISGEECIFRATAVRYTPGGYRDPSMASGTPPPSATPATVWIDERPLTGGTVFVMNEAGKTVSRYDLGASPVPLNPTVDGLTATRAVREAA